MGLLGTHIDGILVTSVVVWGTKITKCFSHLLVGKRFQAEQAEH